ncbi:MAG: serine hydrolase domain-containing protein [Bacteroidota bacterium]|nr:serine hydrolase domain-containing protein [Bacteroidota bacterium]
MKIINKNITVLFLISFVFVQLLVNAQESIDITKIEKGVDRYLSFFSDTNPGAVVSVIKDGDIIFSKAFGMSNIETGMAMNKNQVFSIGELSKTFTSIAIMQLVEKNKLNLDDNICDVFDSFPDYGKKIKIRNLLNHTSGLKNYNKDSLNKDTEIIKYLENSKEVKFVPGSQLVFSNSDYPVLVKIIEKISGKSYKDYLESNIFKKIKMDNSYLPRSKQNIDNLAMPHFKEDDKYVVKNDYSEINISKYIFTNAIDYAKFDKALYTDELLKCENLSKIFTVESLSDTSKLSYYGYGWVLMKKNGVRYFWHGGSASGYSNLVLHLPDTHTTVLILTNRNDGYDFLKMSIHIAKLFDKNLKL